METINVKPLSGSSQVCDFCFSADVIAVYPAADFIKTYTADAAQVSRGGWTACPACVRLIEAGLYRALAARSFHSSMRQCEQNRDPLSEDAKHLWWQTLRALHNQFREFRTGPVVFIHGGSSN